MKVHIFWPFWKPKTFKIYPNGYCNLKSRPILVGTYELTSIIWEPPDLHRREVGTRFASLIFANMRLANLVPTSRRSDTVLERSKLRLPPGGYHLPQNFHYNDVIMGAMASQITSFTIVYSTVYSEADKKPIKAPRHWPFCGEFTGSGEFPAQMASNAENVSI